MNGIDASENYALKMMQAEYAKAPENSGIVDHKMKTIEIEVAMMAFLDIQQNLIVPNISWGMGLHECDLLMLNGSGYATEIEIKVSRSDLLNDKKKPHNHISNKIAQLYFAVPEILQYDALHSIPQRAGLYVIRRGQYKDRVLLIRECEKNKYAVKWAGADRCNLARLGTMRILGLKQKIIKLQNKVS